LKLGKNVGKTSEQKDKDTKRKSAEDGDKGLFIFMKRIPMCLHMPV